ncbi:hypothetical protein ANN_26581 [Periplaneta americana]|uniref:Mos1 transposase HTH domain-containing protein n=1 Tax=Periplaneta americana TaxID=6978 RepID=A0ABQ8RYR6_PERAM|nr:hypothetical protein ANN_26581 [Periplaneta americana]
MAYSRAKLKSKETLRLLEEAYGEAAMKKTQVYAWHKRFSGGRGSIKDDVRSGRPTIATNEAIAQRVRNVVRDDRRKTTKEIAAEGLIHHEFIPEGRTVTKELYVEILRRLRVAVRRKRPEKWVDNNWFLMHDNAPPHRAIIVKNFLARHNITALDHPPYSPDLSPPDYFLFPRLKSHLKGRRFNAEEVIANSTRALRRVSQNGFQACFQELYTHWQKCYGNIAPQTVYGKVTTILYAIIGIPLFLLYLSNIGDILANSFKWTYAKLCLCQGCCRVSRRQQMAPQQTASVGGFMGAEDWRRAQSIFLQVVDLEHSVHQDASEEVLCLVGKEIRCLLSIVETATQSDLSANDNSAYRRSANNESALYRYKTASIDYSRICNRKRISEKSRRLEIQFCRRSLLRVQFKVCHGSLYVVMWLADDPREFNLPTLPQRRITYVPEKLPSKYGVHSEEYLPIRTVTPVVAGM